MTTIRPARPKEAAALTALCIRSKAHWGYDAAFMRQAEAALTISEARIEAGRVLVAESHEGTLLGVAAVDEVDAAGGFDLALLFVEPTAIRTGIGQALFAASVMIAATEGGKRLSILADPFAEAFYKKLGSVRIGEAPSDAIPGRLLPLMEYRIDALQQ